MYGGGGASAVSQSQGNSGVNNTGTQAKEAAKKMKGRHVEMTTVEHYGSRGEFKGDRKSTRLNSSHITRSRMPSSA